MEGVQIVVFAKCQKVFDKGLGNKMISICHEAPQGATAHIIRAVHPFWDHLGKVANATFVNRRKK